MYSYISAVWLVIRHGETERENERKTTLTIKLCVHAILQKSSRAEVDEFQLARFEIDQNVLVLDVPVEDATAGHRLHDADDLTEELPGGVLVQRSLLRDEVEEVLDGLRPLHDQDEGVWTLECIQQFDDAADGLRLAEQTHLHGDVVSVHLEDKKGAFYRHDDGDVCGFYIALFSALEQTHCAFFFCRIHVILKE